MAERVSILVVEDERDTSDMLAAYFESQGFQVMQAAWGQDALQMTARTVPDLILLDIRLPDIDGYEVCRQLRQQRRTQDTPIVFLTEKRERIDKLQGLELGAVEIGVLAWQRQRPVIALACLPLAALAAYGARRASALRQVL